jgi:hypothetical protein
MHENGWHCPFLNRSDARCADHFSLERIGYAFEYCFDQYSACPTYSLLLNERQQRRGVAPAAETSHVHPRVIQVSVVCRVKEPVAVA